MSEIWTLALGAEFDRFTLCFYAKLIVGISAASVSPQDVPKSNLLSPKVNVFQLILF